MTIEWERVGTVSPKSLGDARETAHHAALLLALVGASYIPSRSDDSHTSMTWLVSADALETEIVDAPRPFRVGLRMADLTLLFLDAFGDDTAILPLVERTRKDAIAWLRARIGDAGRDPAALHTSLHFSIAPHSTDSGGHFVRQREAVEELARWYRNAHTLLEGRRAQTPGASDVRCWPHHFDIATLVSCSGGPLQTIGIGMSPGDTSYAEPYFYVGPSPRPTFAVAPLGIGHWHTADWFGAVLTASEIVAKASATEQVELVNRFADDSLAALGTHPKETGT
ncbi:MAG TPA: hypothetical protein VGH98_06590 [Gemmatimonadaceae bacterium]|jgi:hypothetical protein